MYIKHLFSQFAFGLVVLALAQELSPSLPETSDHVDDDTEPERPQKESDCYYAVSYSATKFNEECKDMCGVAVHSGDWDVYDTLCGIEKYRNDDKTDRVYNDGRCFTRWVYGYEDGAIAESPDYSIANVGTPQQCQELCQRIFDCENFLWRARGKGAPHCLLKTKKQVSRALEIQLDGSLWGTIPDPEWAQYCNIGLDVECNSHHYECLICPPQKHYSCVWESHWHLSGPKNCGSPATACGDPTTPLPPTPEPDQPDDPQGPGSDNPQGPYTVAVVGATAGITAVVAAAGGAGAYSYYSSLPANNLEVDISEVEEGVALLTDRELATNVVEADFT